MSPEPVTGERIYRRIKGELMAARYRPGALLGVSAIAEEIGASISPVRDAMQRLVGERMLERHPGGGFLSPQMTEARLRDLYAWHLQLVRSGLGRGGGEVLSFDSEAEDLDGASPARLAEQAARLFAGLAAGSGNQEHVLAVIAAGERLSAARLCEPKIMKDVGPELVALARLAQAGRAHALRRAVSEYHRRRLRRVVRIAALFLEEDPAATS